MRSQVRVVARLLVVDGLPPRVPESAGARRRRIQRARLPLRLARIGLVVVLVVFEALIAVPRRSRRTQRVLTEQPRTEHQPSSSTSLVASKRQ